MIFAGIFSESFSHSTNVFPSKLSGGITYTNNGDGSITLNGVCTAFNPQAIALPVNLPAGRYYLTVNNDKAKTGTGNLYVGMNDINGADYGASLGSINAKATINASAPLRRMFINIFVGAELDNVTIKPMLVSGEGYADFKPYTGEKRDISFPSPVYGGTLDVVSGVLTVEWGIYEPTGTEGVYIEASNNRIAFAIPNEYRTQDTTDVYCTHFKAQTAGAYCYITTSMTVDELKAFFANNSVEIACKLATPQEIQLTPAQITALIGNNTIWSDADGSLTAVYLVSSKYADEHPVGGLGFGFGFGSGSDPDEPADPENPDEQEEPVVDDSENNQMEGEEP